MWSHYQRTIEGIEMNTIKNALEKCRTYVAVQKFGCGHTGIGHGVEDNPLQLLNEAFEELAWLEKREPTLMSDCISAGLPLDVALKYDVQLCRLTNYVRDKALEELKKGPVGELVLVHRKVLNKLGIDDEVINTVAHTPAQQEPVAWYDKIEGMEVSMDVSTGEHDDTHRIFGRVSGVMLQSCGAQDDIILAIEDSRNFTTPPTTPNLNCKSVQRRLATSWGYVRKEEYDMAMVAAAKQQEPVARFNWNEGKFEWLTKYDYYKHHMKPLYLMPPTAAQAARQMRDTAVKKVRYLASLIPLNGQMHTIQIEALLDAASSIAALPIEGEEK